MKYLALAVFAILCASCASMTGGPPKKESRAFALSIAARGGALVPRDEELKDMNVEVSPSVSLDARVRFGPQGHLSFVTGVDYQWDKARAVVYFPPISFSLKYDVSVVSVPFIIGVNSTSTASFLDGSPNVFFGAGGVAYKARLSGPPGLDDNESGIGFVGNVSLQVPIQNSAAMFVLDIRYSRKPIGDDLWEPVENIGGIEVTAGFGVSF